MNKFLSLVATAAAIVASAPASAVVVGGINFGSLPGNLHLETATLAETVAFNPGDTVQGYGLITSVNGAVNYCATGTCYLYYYFNGFALTSNSGGPLGSSGFTGGVVTLYYSATPALNLLNQTSAVNVATIQAMTPWVTLTGHNNYDSALGLTGSLTSTTSVVGDGTALNPFLLSETGQGMVDVNLAGPGLSDVKAFLNGNAINDNCSNAGATIGANGCAAHVNGFADLQLTNSASSLVVNSNDLASGAAANCSTVAATGWCLQGTLNARGLAVIPEPTSLALVGLALVGVGVARRRITTKQ